MKTFARTKILPLRPNFEKVIHLSQEFSVKRRVGRLSNSFFIKNKFKRQEFLKLINESLTIKSIEIQTFR